MPEFTIDIKKVAKVELSGGLFNLSIADLPAAGDSLLLTGIQSIIAVAIMPVKASLEGEPALYELFFTATNPKKNPGDSFYTASFGGRLEIRS